MGDHAPPPDPPPVGPAGDDPPPRPPESTYRTVFREWFDALAGGASGIRTIDRARGVVNRLLATQPASQAHVAEICEARKAFLELVDVLRSQGRSELPSILALLSDFLQVEFDPAQFQLSEKDYPDIASAVFEHVKFVVSTSLPRPELVAALAQDLADATPLQVRWDLAFTAALRLQDSHLTVVVAILVSACSSDPNSQAYYWRYIAQQHSVPVIASHLTVNNALLQAAGLGPVAVFHIINAVANSDGTRCICGATILEQLVALGRYASGEVHPDILGAVVSAVRAMLSMNPRKLDEWFGFCQKLAPAFPTTNFDAGLIPAIQQMTPPALTALFEELPICTKFPPTATFLESCLYHLPLATTLSVYRKRREQCIPFQTFVTYCDFMLQQNLARTILPEDWRSISSYLAPSPVDLQATAIPMLLRPVQLAIAIVAQRTPPDSLYLTIAKIDEWLPWQYLSLFDSLPGLESAYMDLLLRASDFHASALGPHEYSCRSPEAIARAIAVLRQSTSRLHSRMASVFADKFMAPARTEAHPSGAEAQPDVHRNSQAQPDAHHPSDHAAIPAGDPENPPGTVSSAFQKMHHDQRHNALYPAVPGGNVAQGAVGPEAGSLDAALQDGGSQTNTASQSTFPDGRSTGAAAQHVPCGHEDAPNDHVVPVAAKGAAHEATVRGRDAGEAMRHDSIRRETGAPDRNAAPHSDKLDVGHRTATDEGVTNAASRRGAPPATADAFASDTHPAAPMEKRRPGHPARSRDDAQPQDGHQVGYVPLQVGSPPGPLSEAPLRAYNRREQDSKGWFDSLKSIFTGKRELPPDQRDIVERYATALKQCFSQPRTAHNRFITTIQVVAVEFDRRNGVRGNPYFSDVTLSLCNIAGQVIDEITNAHNPELCVVFLIYAKLLSYVNLLDDRDRQDERFKDLEISVVRHFTEMCARVPDQSEQLRAAHVLEGQLDKWFKLFFDTFRTNWKQTNPPFALLLCAMNFARKPANKGDPQYDFHYAGYSVDLFPSFWRYFNFFRAILHPATILEFFHRVRNHSIALSADTTLAMVRLLKRNYIEERHKEQFLLDTISGVIRNAVDKNFESWLRTLQDIQHHLGLDGAVLRQLLSVYFESILTQANLSEHLRTVPMDNIVVLEAVRTVVATGSFQTKATAEQMLSLVKRFHRVGIFNALDFMHYCDNNPRASPQQIAEMTALVFQGYEHETPRNCTIKTLLAPFSLLLSRIRDVRDVPPAGSLAHSLLGRLLDLGPGYAAWVMSAVDSQEISSKELHAALHTAAQGATITYLERQHQRHSAAISPSTFLANDSPDAGLSRIARNESNSKLSPLYELFCEAFADVLGSQLLEQMPTKADAWIEKLVQLQWQVFTSKDHSGDLLLHPGSHFSFTLLHKLLKSLILHMEKFKAFSQDVSKVFKLFHLMQSLDIPDHAQKAASAVRALLDNLVDLIIQHRARFLTEEITVREILEFAKCPEREFTGVVESFLQAWQAADDFQGARRGDSTVTLDSLRALCHRVQVQERELQRLLRLKRWLDARLVLVVDPNLVPHGTSFDFDSGWSVADMTELLDVLRGSFGVLDEQVLILMLEFLAEFQRPTLFDLMLKRKIDLKAGSRQQRERVALAIVGTCTQELSDLVLRVLNEQIPTIEELHFFAQIVEHVPAADLQADLQLFARLLLPTGRLTPQDVDRRVNTMLETLHLLSAATTLPAFLRCQEIYKINLPAEHRNGLETIEVTLKTLSQGRHVDVAIPALLAQFRSYLGALKLEDLRFFEALLHCEPLTTYLAHQQDLDNRLTNATAMLTGNQFAQNIITSVLICKTILTPFFATGQPLEDIAQHVRYIQTDMDLDRIIKILSNCQENLATIQMWLADSAGSSIESVLRKIKHLSQSGRFISNSQRGSQRGQLFLKYKVGVSEEITLPEDQLLDLMRAAVLSIEDFSEEQDLLPGLGQAVDAPEHADGMDAQFLEDLQLQAAERRENDRTLRDFVSFCEQVQVLHRERLILEEEGHPRFQDESFEINISETTLDHLQIQVEELGHCKHSWAQLLTSTGRSCPRLRSLQRRQLLRASQLLQQMSETDNADARFELASSLWPFVMLCLPEASSVANAASMACGLRKLGDTLPIGTLVEHVNDALRLADDYTDPAALLNLLARIVQRISEDLGLEHVELLEPEQLGAPTLLSRFCRVTRVLESNSPTCLFSLVLELSGSDHLWPWQLLDCTPQTTESELAGFVACRMAFQSLPFFLLCVDKLPASMREFLQKELLGQLVDADTLPCETFLVFTSPTGLELFSFLQEVPCPADLLNRSRANFRIKASAEQLVQRYSVAQLLTVQGEAGVGKSKFIESECTAVAAMCCVAVNEDFTEAIFLHALNRVLSGPLTADRPIGLHINISPHVLPCHLCETLGPECMQSNDSPLHRVGKALNEFLTLGMVSDKISGNVLHLPSHLQWRIFVEVPSIGAEDFDVLSFLPMVDLLAARHTVTMQNFPFLRDADSYLVAFAYSMSLKEGLNNLRREITGRTLSPDVCSQLLDDMFSLPHNREVLCTRSRQHLFVALMSKRIRDLYDIRDFVEQQLGEEYPEHFNPTAFTLFMSECLYLCSRRLETHKQIFTVRKQGLNLFLPGYSDDEAAAINQQYHIGYQNFPDTEKVSIAKLRAALAPAMSVERLLPFMESAGFVLTTDIAIKLLMINELRDVSANLILQGDTGTGKTEILQMLSLLLNSDTQLVPDRLGALKDLAEKLCSKLIAEPAAPAAAAADAALVDADQPRPAANVQRLVLDAADRTEISSLMSVEAVCAFLLGRYRQVENDVEEAYRWSTICCEVVRQLFEDYPLLVKPAEVKGVLQAFEESQDLAELGERFQLGVEELESFVRHAFTSKTEGIFYRILMSERITASHWRARITEINAKARELRALDGKAKIVVFIDELNTAMILGNVKEVLCDRRLDGEPLERNIFFVGAVNPRRVDAVRTSAYNATGVRNNIVEADFVVQTMSDSLKLLVLDFGTMRPDQERLFLHSLLQDPSISVNKFLSTSSLDKEETRSDELKLSCLQQLMEMILFSQDFLRRCRREGKIESRVHVSIRDIMRAVKLYTFFSEHSKREGLQQLLFDGENLLAGEVSSRRHWVSLCLSIAITYYFRLPERFSAVVGEMDFETRREFLDAISTKLITLRAPHYVHFTDIVHRRIDTFFSQTKLPEGIAPTRTLRENIYCMAVCIEACIPLIVTGPPGCSKTLSFNMTAENMRGVGSTGLIFRHLKKLSRFNYQCSEQSTAAEIEAVARDTESRQENLIQHRQYGEMSTLFLDEAGLPHERKQAMKIMHYYLDHPKVAYVILSNNTLDAAKTNRCVQLMQINSSMEDLKALATGCLCPRDGKPNATLRQTIQGLCTAFQKCNDSRILADIPLQAQGDDKEKHLFHIRDLVYLLRFLKRAASERGAESGDLDITEDMLLAGLRRNFNGLSSRGFCLLAQLFFKEIQVAGRQSFRMPDEADCRPNTLKTLREALRDRVKKGDNPSHSAFRHIMVIDPTNCSAAVDVLIAEDLLAGDRRRLVRCNVSDFADDANDREHSLRISELKSAMLRGDRVVMVNSSAIHSSFFDIFNKQFMSVASEEREPKYFANISIGPFSRPTEVHPDFQVIVVVPFASLATTPLPFLNRFEKYIVGISDLLVEKVQLGSHAQVHLELIQHLSNGVNDFIVQMRPNSFYGLSAHETLASILLTAVTSARDGQFVNLEVSELPRALSAKRTHAAATPQGTWENRLAETIRLINFKLMQLLRPEAMVTVGRTLLNGAYMKEYLHYQEHFSVVSCLKGLLPPSHPMSKLVIFTRTCPELAQLIHSQQRQEELLRDLSSDNSHVGRVTFTSLSGFRSAASCASAIEGFMKEETEHQGVLLVIADLREISLSQVNFFKSTVDKCMAPNKKVVMLAHFSAESTMFGSLWDVVFLNGWETLYVDGLGMEKSEVASGRWIDIGFGTKELPSREELLTEFAPLIDRVVRDICEQVAFAPSATVRAKANQSADMYVKAKRAAFVDKLLKSDVPEMHSALCELIISSWRSSLDTILTRAGRTLTTGRSVASFLELITSGLEYLVSSVMLAFIRMLGSHLNAESLLAGLLKAQAKAEGPAYMKVVAALAATVPLPEDERLKFQVSYSNIRCVFGRPRVFRVPFCHWLLTCLDGLLDVALLAVKSTAEQEQRQGQAPLDEALIVAKFSDILSGQRRLHHALESLSTSTQTSLMLDLVADMVGLRMDSAKENLLLELSVARVLLRKAVSMVNTLNAGAQSKLNQLLACVWLSKSRQYELRQLDGMLAALDLAAEHFEELDNLHCADVGAFMGQAVACGLRKMHRLLQQSNTAEDLTEWAQLFNASATYLQDETVALPADRLLLRYLHLALQYCTYCPQLNQESCRLLRQFRLQEGNNDVLVFSSQLRYVHQLFASLRGLCSEDETRRFVEHAVSSLLPRTLAQLEDPAAMRRLTEFLRIVRAQALDEEGLNDMLAFINAACVASVLFPLYEAARHPDQAPTPVVRELLALLGENLREAGLENTELPFVPLTLKHFNHNAPSLAPLLQSCRAQNVPVEELVAQSVPDASDLSNIIFGIAYTINSNAASSFAAACERYNRSANDMDLPLEVKCIEKAALGLRLLRVAGSAFRAENDKEPAVALRVDAVRAHFGPGLPLLLSNLRPSMSHQAAFLSAINPPPREALLRSRELLALLELEPWLLTAVPLELPPNHGLPFEFPDENNPRSNLYAALCAAMANDTAAAFIVANAGSRENQALLRMFLVVHSFYDFFDKNRPCPALQALLQRAEVLQALAIQEVKPFYDFLARGPLNAAGVEAGDELQLLFSNSPEATRGGHRHLMINHLAVMLGMPLEKSYYLNIARNVTQLKPMGGHLAIGSNYDNSYRDCGFRCEVGPNAVPVMQGGNAHFHGCLLSHTISNSYTWMAMCWGSLVFGDAYLRVIADPGNHVLNYVNQDVYAGRGVQRSPRAAQNYYLLTRAATFFTFSSQVPTLATQQMEASFFFTQSLLQMFNASLAEGPAGLPSLPVLTPEHVSVLEAALKRNVFDFVLRHGPELQAALEVTERLHRKLESGLRDECTHLNAFVSKQPIFPSFLEFQFELSKVPERQAAIEFCKALSQHRVIRHLPLLVRFYVWLHEALDCRYTPEQAEQVSIDQIVEDVGRLDGPAAGLQAETLVHLVCEAWPEITANVSVDLCPAAARERAFEGYLLDLNRETVLARLVSTADDPAGGEVYRVIMALLGLQNKVLRAPHVRTLVENQQLNQHRILCPDALFPELHISFLTSNDRRILRVPDDFELYCASRCTGVPNRPGFYDFDAVDKAILGLLGGCHVLSTATRQHYEFKRSFRFNSMAADAQALLAAAKADPDLKGVFRLDEEEVRLARPLCALQEEARLWPLTELDAAEARVVELALAKRSERVLQRCVSRLCDVMRCMREQVAQPQPDHPDRDALDQSETFVIPQDMNRCTLQAFVQKQKLAAVDELLSAFGRLTPNKWRAAAAALSSTVLGMRSLFQDIGVAFNTPLDLVVLESHVEDIVHLDAYLSDTPNPVPHTQADLFADAVRRINRAIEQQSMPEYELLQPLLDGRTVTLVFAFRVGLGQLPPKEIPISRKDMETLPTLEDARLTFVMDKKEHFLKQLQSLATSLCEPTFLNRLRKAGNDKAPLRDLLADAKLLDQFDVIVVEKFIPLDVRGCNFSKFVRFLYSACGTLKLSLITLRERKQRTCVAGNKYTELVPRDLADVQNELETGENDSDNAPLTPGGGSKHVSYAMQGSTLREFVQKLRYVDTQPWTSKPQPAPVKATVERVLSIEKPTQTTPENRAQQSLPLGPPAGAAAAQQPQQPQAQQLLLVQTPPEAHQRVLQPAIPPTSQGASHPALQQWQPASYLPPQSPARFQQYPVMQTSAQAQPLSQSQLMYPPSPQLQPAASTQLTTNPTLSLAQTPETDQSAMRDAAIRTIPSASLPVNPWSHAPVYTSPNLPAHPPGGVPGFGMSLAQSSLSQSGLLAASAAPDDYVLVNSMHTLASSQSASGGVLAQSASNAAWPQPPPQLSAAMSPPRSTHGLTLPGPVYPSASLSAALASGFAPSGSGAAGPAPGVPMHGPVGLAAPRPWLPADPSAPAGAGAAHFTPALAAAGISAYSAPGFLPHSPGTFAAYSGPALGASSTTATSGHFTAASLGTAMPFSTNQSAFPVSSAALQASTVGFSSAVMPFGSTQAVPRLLSAAQPAVPATQPAAPQTLTAPALIPEQQMTAVSQGASPVAAPNVGAAPAQSAPQVMAAVNPQPALSQSNLQKTKADIPFPPGKIVKDAQISEVDLMSLADRDLVPHSLSQQGKRLFPLRVIELLRSFPTEEELQPNVPADAVVVSVAGVRRVATALSEPLAAVAARMGIRLEDVQALGDIGLLRLQGDQVLTPAAQIAVLAADLSPVHEAFGCTERSARILVARGVVRVLQRGDAAVVLRSSRAAFLKADWRAECITQAQAIDDTGASTAEDLVLLLEENDEESAYFSLPAQALGAPSDAPGSAVDFWFLKSGQYFS